MHPDVNPSLADADLLQETRGYTEALRASLGLFLRLAYDPIDISPDQDLAQQWIRLLQRLLAFVLLVEKARSALSLVTEQQGRL